MYTFLFTCTCEITFSSDLSSRSFYRISYDDSSLRSTLHRNHGSQGSSFRKRRRRRSYLENDFCKCFDAFHIAAHRESPAEETLNFKLWNLNLSMAYIVKLIQI